MRTFDELSYFYFHFSDLNHPRKFELSSSESDYETESQFGISRTHHIKSPIFPKEGLPLLENDSEDSEIEVDILESRHRSRSTNSDDYYFKETRAWTSVRDKHIRMIGSEEHNCSDFFQKEQKEQPSENILNLNLSD